MFSKHIFTVSMAICILLLVNRALPVAAGASSEEPLFQRMRKL